MSRGLAQKDFHEFNTDMELALGALAAYGPEGACEYLYDTHDIEVTPEKLERHRRRFPEKYQEIREKLAPRLESMAVADMRSNIVKSNAVIGVALERADQQLKDGRGDASKIGRDIADIMAKSTDKMLALQGRPTHITADRSLAEVMRALKAISPDLVIDDAEIVNEKKELTNG